MKIHCDEKDNTVNCTAESPKDLIRIGQLSVIVANATLMGDDNARDGNPRVIKMHAASLLAHIQPK